MTASAAALTLAVAAVGPAGATAAESGSIAGTVTDASGPAAGVCVTASSTTFDAMGSASATTAEDGTYTVTGLPEASYIVQFAASPLSCTGAVTAHITEFYDGATQWSDADHVAVAAGESVDGIDAQLERGGSISGTVRDADGDPITTQDICVTASSGHPYVSPTPTPGTLPPAPPPVPPTTGPVPPSTTPLAPPVGVPAVPDGAPTAPAAAPTAPDGDVPPAPVPTVPAPASPVPTVPTPPMPVGPSYYGSATTNEDGEYTIAGLPSASYRIQFQDCQQSERNDVPVYHGGTDDPASAEVVVLTAGGTETGIDGQMRPGTSITGTVYGGAGTTTPLENVCIQVTAAGSGGTMPSAPVPTYTPPTDVEGRYAVRRLPERAGGYRLRFADCATNGPHVARWLGGDFRESSAPAVIPTVEAPVAGRDVHLEVGATISGRITDAQDDPIPAGVCVSVNRVPSSSESYADWYQAQVNETDTDGRYTVRGLPAGSYSALAVNCLGPSSPRNDLPEHRTSTIAVAAGQAVAGIDFAMRPATTISGRVFAGEGEGRPLANVCVQATSGTGPGSVGTTLMGASTDADGRYTLKGIDPALGYKVSFASCMLLPGSPAPQFYDGVSTIEEATVVQSTVADPTTGIDAHLAAGAPVATITGGPAALASTNVTDARFAFVADAVGATFECALDGGAWEACTSPHVVPSLDAGSHTFRVRAALGDDVQSVPTTRTWTVSPEGSNSTSEGTVAGGGTFSTDPGATPSEATPVVAAVTLPVAGTVTVTKEPATTPSGNGYTVFGQQLNMTARDASGPVVATTTSPIGLRFDVAASEIPAGTDPGTVSVLRNGALVPDCTGPSGEATPDPCVSGRTALPDGGLSIAVLTTRLSVWNLVVTEAAVAAPVNTAVPVVTGTAALGATLTASAGEWTGADLEHAYAWLRDGVAIEGATGSTYEVTGADQGHGLTVRVTATNDGGTATAVSATLPIPAAPLPETPDPETPDPETPDPETPDPGTPVPGTPDPGTPDPGTPDPGTSNPGTSNPGTSNPGGGGGGGAAPVPPPGGPQPGPGPVGPGPGPGKIGPGTAAPVGPTAKVGKLPKLKLAKVLKQGIRLPLRCSAACKLDVRVAVDGRTARKVKLAKKARTTTVAKGKGNGTTKQRTVVIRFTGKAKRALRRLRSVKVTVTITVRGAPGTTPTVVKRRITIKR